MRMRRRGRVMRRRRSTRTKTGLETLLPRNHRPERLVGVAIYRLRNGSRQCCSQRAPLTSQAYSRARRRRATDAPPEPVSQDRHLGGRGLAARLGGQLGPAPLRRARAPWRAPHGALRRGAPSQGAREGRRPRRAEGLGGGRRVGAWLAKSKRCDVRLSGRGRAVMVAVGRSIGGVRCAVMERGAGGHDS